MKKNYANIVFSAILVIVSVGIIIGAKIVFDNKFEQFYQLVAWLNVVFMSMCLLCIAIKNILK